MEFLKSQSQNDLSDTGRATILPDMPHLRILLADDHEIVRLGLRSLLERQPGYEVIAEAESGAEAVARAIEFEPNIVLMDIRMPGMSGVEACEQITRKVPNAKVIMLTAYAEDEMLFSAIRAGAAGYVLKQVGSNDLIKAIEAAARGEASLDPALTQRVFAEVRRAVQDQTAKAFGDLTDQELRVLAQIAEGKTNRDIAAILFLGEGTVRNYASTILSKLNLSNRAEAVAYAIKHRIGDLLNDS